MKRSIRRKGRPKSNRRRRPVRLRKSSDIIIYKVTIKMLGWFLALKFGPG